MRFDNFGMLTNPNDFEIRIDIAPKSCYVRTNTDTVDTPDGVDGSHARVASELAPTYLQPDLWSHLP